MWSSAHDLWKNGQWMRFCVKYPLIQRHNIVFGEGEIEILEGLGQEERLVDGEREREGREEQLDMRKG